MTSTPEPKPTAQQTAQANTAGCLGCSGCLLIIVVGLALGIGMARCNSDAQKASQSSSTAPLPPIKFGVGDDLSAWLSRCDPPESDVSSAYDNPRPPIVTRFLTYPSKAVRVILVPKNASIADPPPYSKWSLVGITDPTNDQPIRADEALRRMGSSCRS
jgi:hypothetical protein